MCCSYSKTTATAARNEMPSSTSELSEANPAIQSALPNATNTPDIQRVTNQMLFITRCSFGVEYKTCLVEHLEHLIHYSIAFPKAVAD